MAASLRIGSCAFMAATVASFTGLSSRNCAYADGPFRFSPFSSSSPQTSPPTNQTKAEPTEVEAPKSDSSGFDPDALDEAAKILREFNKHPLAKKVFELMRWQEDVRKAELDAGKAQHDAFQAKQDIERQQKMAEEQRKVVEQELSVKAQQARQKDELARKRMQTDHESKRLQNAEMVTMQEKSALRQELVRRQTEERIQAQIRKANKESSDIVRETTRKNALAEAEARALEAKTSQQQDANILKEVLKGEKEKWLVAINTTFGHIEDGMRLLLTDRSRLVMAVGGVTALAAGVYTTREGARVSWGYINRILGQPSLIRESSIAKYPLVGTVSRAYKKLLNYSTGAGRTETKTSLENIVLHPSLHKRIDQLARATANTKSHEAPFRNMLFYGPPGTGKTMVAKEIARKSGLDYAMMTGGDVAPLGADAVTKIHQIFDWSKNSKKGLLLFIDEADAFLCERNSIYMSEAQRSALNALLYRTGDQSRDTVLVLATNRPADLDSAVTDRIDEVIEFPIPGEEERVKLLKLYLNKYLHGKDETDSSRWQFFKSESQKITVKDLSEDVIREAARKTQGFSGREIAKLMASVQASVYGSPDCVLDSHLFMEIVDIKIEEHQKRIQLAAQAGN